MKKYKGVIFDLDDTLSSDSVYLSTGGHDTDFKTTAEYKLYTFLKPHLKIVDWEWFYEVFLISRKEIKELLPHTAASHNRYLYIQRTLENFNLRLSPRIVYQANQVYWSWLISRIDLFPGVYETLEKIKFAHFMTGIVTDLTADVQIQKLVKLKIAKFIDYLVTSEEAGADKPYVGTVELMLEKMSLKKDQVIFVGNNPKTDIEVSNRAGIQNVLYDYYNKYKESVRNNPSFYITEFSKLNEIIGLKEELVYKSDERLLITDIGSILEKSHIITEILIPMLSEVDSGIIGEAYWDYKRAKINKAEFWIRLGFSNYQKIEKEFLVKLQLSEEWKVLLEELKQLDGLNMAILSNIPEDWGEYLRKKYKLDEYFTEITYSGEYRTVKPDPVLYRKVMEKFHEVKIRNIYFLDNELDELASIQNLLCNSIWYAKKDMKVNYIPDYVIYNLEEIMDIFKND